ncbi:acetyltransferase [Flavobacterium luteolum]|uniref:acetyltransferase n=1 Tax=Flavobacterium luteolum TaxID=3003259 RepID=UPI00248E4A07|nr:acetyltransferase [Flavobacterium luteolum]
METIKYLYGASGHCKVILDILKSKKNVIEGIIDDNPQFDFLLNVPVLKASETKISSESEVIISIGNNAIRKKIVSKLETSFFTAIHESAIISETAKIKNGSVVMAGVIINSSAKIGEHCIINTGSIIEHDCQIASYCHISPNASLAGNVSVGEGTHVGIGACVIQGVKIGKWASIGAGAVILKDVPDFAVIVGNPGKIIKFNKVNE